MLRILVCFFLMYSGFEAFAQSQAQLISNSKLTNNWAESEYYRLESSKHFIYYQNDQDSIARFIARFMPGILQFYENIYEINLTGPLQILLFNDISEIEQSNLNSEFLQLGNRWNIPLGGNKILVYVSTNPDIILDQVRYGVSKLLINEFLYGGNSVQRLQAQVSLTLPNWFADGLAHFTSYGMNVDIFRESNLYLKVVKPRSVANFVAQKPTSAGVYFWHCYINSFSWSSVIFLLRQVRISSDINGSLRRLHGISFVDFIKSAHIASSTFNFSNASIRLYDNFNSKIFSRKKGEISPLKLNYGGNSHVYLRRLRSKNQVLVYNQLKNSAELFYTFKRPRIRSEFNGLIENCRPLAALGKGDSRLSVLIKDKREYRLIIGRRGSDGKWTTIVDSLKGFQWIQSMDWSRDASSIVLSAWKNGVNSIYQINTYNFQISKIYTDTMPKYDVHFMMNSSDPVFYSQISKSNYSQNFDFKDSSRVGIFTLKKNMKYQLVNLYDSLPYGLSNFVSIDTGKFLFQNLSENVLKVVSFNKSWNNPVVSTFSDTLNLFFKFLGYNSTRSSLYYFYDSVGNRGDRFISVPFDQKLNTSLDFTDFNGEKKYLQYGDNSYLENSKVHSKKSPYSNLNYGLFSDVVFDTGYLAPMIYNDFYRILYFEDDSLNLCCFSENFFKSLIKKHSLYLKNSKYILGSSLEKYAFGVGNTLYEFGMPLLSLSTAFHLNSPSALFSGQVEDVFGNKKIYFSGLLGNKEGNHQFLMMYQNLSKQIDWNLTGIYSNLNQNWIYSKEFSQESSSNKVLELHVGLRWPFMYNHFLGLTIGHISSKSLSPLLGINVDKKSNETTRWNGMRLEWNFDCLNYYFDNAVNGIRLNLFTESYLYQNFSIKSGGIYGFDFKAYKDINRAVVWATRLNAQFSYGPNSINFMLGGVNQPILINYNYDMPIPNTDKVMASSFSMGIRGLPLNSRNGTSFSTMSHEIRFIPSAFRGSYFASSSFSRSLVLLVFSDFGTVWNKGDFWKLSNSNFPSQIVRGPVAVTLGRFSPLLASFGFGVKAHIWQYHARIDRSWPWENYSFLKPNWVLSLGSNF